MMKSLSDWKLTSSDIHQAVDCLNQLVGSITEESKPFKQEVEFVKAFTSVAVVKVNGVEKWIRQQFCYFALGHPVSGEKVFVDNRHLFTP